MLECVVNVSEGRDQRVIDRLTGAAGAGLLDVHSDAFHNRSVLTLVGERAPREVTTCAHAHLDLRRHHGVHPRFGVVDVVPFVPLAGSAMPEAVAARDRFADWVSTGLGIPAFLYGPERTLPEVRREAFRGLSPDRGPAEPHDRAGAVAVGARSPLVAWNVYLAGADLDTARRIASAVRRPELRALGLSVGDEVQVSMNLIAPAQIGPAEAWDLVAGHAAIDRAELVGLLPRAVLDRTPAERWSELDLAPDRTIESRLGT